MPGPPKPLLSPLRSISDFIPAMAFVALSHPTASSPAFVIAGARKSTANFAPAALSDSIAGLASVKAFVNASAICTTAGAAVIAISRTAVIAAN